MEDSRPQSLSLLKSLFVFPIAEIDSFVFKLHYKLTFAILLALSILVGWQQHFGTAINCTSRDDLPRSLINDYCLVYSTYSKKESWDKKVGEEIPYPGVDKRHVGITKVYHTYYQWVSLVLFIQAVFFLLPRCFWKHMESGRVQDIVKGMAKYESVNEEQRQQNICHLSRRLRSEMHRNWKYFLCYIATGVLNLVNVIVQIQLMNVFLRGQFSYFGQQVVQFSGDRSWISNQDPGLKLFPRMAMCDFFRYGSSGDVQLHQAMCLLPLNFLHEKIYAFLWFWFVFLAIVSCIPLICLALFCLSMRFRVVSLIVGGSRLLKVKNVSRIVSVCNIPDCFLIRLVSQNLSSETFRDLVMYIIKEDSKLTDNETTGV